MVRRLACTLLCGVSLVPVSSALAQDDGGGPLDEIVVTATKRAQSTQDISGSVVALNAETFQESNVREFNDVLNLTPGAAFTKFSGNQNVITIRGIGSGDDGAAGDAATAVHLNGVFIARDGARDFSYFDMERVEILRGPQGTLYGKNALAGVVNFITARPTQETETLVEATRGNFGLFEARGVHNAPLGDDLAVRFVAGYQTRDGYSTNLTTGNDVGDVENVTLRGSALYEPADDWSLLVVADYANDDATGAPRKPRPEFGSAFLLNFLGLQIPPTTDDVYEVELNTDGVFERDSSGVTVELNKDIGEGTLTWLNGYRALDYVSEYDLDGTLQTYRTQKIDEQSDQFSSELRYVSPAAEQAGDLDYILGAYYLYVDTSRLETQDIYAGLTLRDFAGPNVPPVPQDTIIFHDQSNRTDAAALFADVNYAVSDRFRIGAGARYSYETKDFSVLAQCGGPDAPFTLRGFTPTGVALGGPGNGGTCNANIRPAENDQSLFYATADDSWEKVTFRAGAEFDASADTLLYATFSQGFKSGGFGPGPATQIAAETPFDEETADAYEAGVKATVFQGRGRINAAVFFTEYDDLQVGLLDQTTGALTIQNAGSAEVKGFETDFVFAPIDGLEISGSYAYLDTEYTDFGDDTGNSLRGPDNSGSLGATYEVPVGAARMTFHGDVNYKEEFFQTSDADVRALIPERTLVNLNVTYYTPNDGVAVSVWGKNVTDETEILQVVPLPRAIGSDSAIAAYGPPATYGVTVRLAF